MAIQNLVQFPVVISSEPKGQNACWQSSFRKKRKYHQSKKKKQFSKVQREILIQPYLTIFMCDLLLFEIHGFLPDNRKCKKSIKVRNSIKIRKTAIIKQLHSKSHSVINQYHISSLCETHTDMQEDMYGRIEYPATIEKAYLFQSMMSKISC